jgi:hypothetical protein
MTKRIAEWSQIPLVGLRFSKDTVMDRPSAELLAEVYPGVTLNREVGEFGTLLSIDRARAALGFTPQHPWRDHVDPRSSRP